MVSCDLYSFGELSTSDDGSSDGQTDGITTETDGETSEDASGDDSTSENVTNGDSTEDNSKDNTEDNTNGTGGDDVVGPELERGVIISKVYGPGTNTDATVGCGFIELYNTLDKSMSLDGMALFYIEESTVTKLAFENTEIGAGKYLLIKCADVIGYDDSNAVLKVKKYDLGWNISVDNKEFDLILAPAASKFTADEDYRDRSDLLSYVRASLVPDVDVYSVDDLSKNKVIVRTTLSEDSGFHLVNLKNSGTEEIVKITPKTSEGNVNTYIDSRFTEVKFSKTGGVYSDEFSLTLSAPVGYTIYYTTDGSDPRTNGVRYTGSIQIKNTDSMPWGPTIMMGIDRLSIFGNVTPSSSTMFGGIVIKACAKSKAETTAVYTNTYFVSKKIEEANVAVMSMSLDLDDFLGTENGAYYTYQYDLWGTRPRSRAYLEFMDENGVKQGGSYIEFAVSGNGSSNTPMKSLRLYYKDPLDENDPASDSLEYPLFGDWSKNIEGQTISSFDRILIRDAGNDFSHSYLRDALCQRMAYGLNVDSMAYRPLLVFVNGEFWGMYNCRERYSPEYFNQKYGVLEENVAMIENESPLKYNVGPGSYNTDYVSSAGDPNEAVEFNKLVTYIKQHDLSDPEVYKYVSDRIDVDSFIDYWIVNSFFCNKDWPGNNIKVWRNVDENDPSGMDTKWRFVLLDLDFCMAYVNVNNVTTNMLDEINNNTRCGAIMAGFMENEEFKLKFAKRAYELVSDTFSPDKTIATLDSMAEGIEGIIGYQFIRYPVPNNNMSYWRSQLEVMRDYLELRPQYYLQQVYNYTGYAESELSISFKVAVVTDPDKVNVTVNGEKLTNGETTLKFEENTTINVSATAKQGYKVTAIVFVDNLGNVEKKNGSSATFNVTVSGSVIVYTESLNKSGDLDIVSGVTAGMNNVFYLDSDGKLYAWGDNRSSALGLDISAKLVTSPVFIMDNVAKVETAHGYDASADGSNTSMTAVLTRDGKLYTVGNNSYGQLGRSGDQTKLLPVSFSGKIVDVAVGYDHMVILDENGNMWGVGNNSRGQLGSQNYGGTAQAFQRIATGVAKIAAGRRNSMYITKNGSLYALGDNRWCKISDGDQSDVTTPRKIASNIAEVWGSTHQMLILANDGTLYYLGWRSPNTFEQGDNSWVMFEVCKNVVEAEMYDYHVIVRTKDGKVYGYGLNDNAQMGGQAGSSSLGQGNLKLITDNAVDIAAGSGFTVILKKDGSIVMLGRNDYGQAGNGTNGGNVSMQTVKFP